MCVLLELLQNGGEMVGLYSVVDKLETQGRRAGEHSKDVEQVRRVPQLCGLPAGALALPVRGPQRRLLTRWLLAPVCCAAPYCTLRSLGCALCWGKVHP